MRGGDETEDDTKPRAASLEKGFFSTRQKASLDHGSALTHLDGWDDDGAVATKEHPKPRFERTASQAKFDALQQQKIQQENEGAAAAGGGGGGGGGSGGRGGEGGGGSGEGGEGGSAGPDVSKDDGEEPVRSTPSLTNEAEEEAAGPPGEVAEVAEEVMVEEEEGDATQTREASTKSVGDYFSDDGGSVREGEGDEEVTPPATPPAPAPAPSAALLSAGGEGRISEAIQC